MLRTYAAAPHLIEKLPLERGVKNYYSITGKENNNGYQQTARFPPRETSTSMP